MERSIWHQIAKEVKKNFHGKYVLNPKLSEMHNIFEFENRTDLLEKIWTKDKETLATMTIDGFREFYGIENNHSRQNIIDVVFRGKDPEIMPNNDIPSTSRGFSGNTVNVNDDTDDIDDIDDDEICQAFRESTLVQKDMQKELELITAMQNLSFRKRSLQVQKEMKESIAQTERSRQTLKNIRNARKESERMRKMK